MRQIEAGEIFDEDEDELLFMTGDGLKWKYDDLRFADWKDNEEQLDSVCELAQKGSEVIILNNGSDTYIFASMADALPL